MTKDTKGGVSDHAAFFLSADDTASIMDKQYALVPKWSEGYILIITRIR